MEFSIADKTVITEGACKLQPAELKAGRKVEIQFSVENGKNVAHLISIQPKPSSLQTGRPEARASERSQRPQQLPPEMEMDRSQAPSSSSQ